MAVQRETSLDRIERLSKSDNLVTLSASDYEMIELAKGSLSLAEKPGKNNWIEHTSDYGLPKYIAEIARALIRGGMSKSRAIATAISRVKVWAAGGDGVNADTKAKAAKAVAEWQALKAKNAARVSAKKAKK